MHELSWFKIQAPTDVLKAGDSCEFVIDRLEHSNEGAPLGSLRRVHPEKNPWHDPSAYSVGNKFIGELVAKVEYGWFIRHHNGIECLLHASDLPPMESSIHAAKLGDGLAVEISACDAVGEIVSVKLAPESN